MPAVQAKVSFEIELTVVGTPQPGYQGDSTEPGYDAYVEDAEVTDIAVLQYVVGGEWRSKSVLTDVDTNNPEVRKLINNLTEAFGNREIEEAILIEEVLE